MPKRHLRQLEDSYFNAAWQTAIEAAVQVSSGMQDFHPESSCFVVVVYAGGVSLLHGKPWLQPGLGSVPALHVHILLPSNGKSVGSCCLPCCPAGHCGGR